MGLIDEIIDDVATITSDEDDFGVLITFTTPDGSITKTIAGLHVKHHLNVDTEGNPVSGKKAVISFSEKVLSDTGYPVRNSKQEVALSNHKVSVKDNTGIVKNYVMQIIFPDETMGLITCTLEDYKAE